MVDRPSLEGTAISLSADSSGRGRADSFCARRRRGAGERASRARPLSFAPTLQSVLPAGSTLMLDVDGLDRAAPELLRAAATAGVATNVAPLLARLGAALAAEGVSVQKITSIFRGETAVGISPGPTPALLIVSRTANQAATQSELAQIEAPLTALFPAPSSGPGQIPGLADRAGRRGHRARARPRRRIAARLRRVRRARGRLHERRRDRPGRAPRPFARRRAGLPDGALGPARRGVLATLYRLQPAPQPRRANRTDERRAHTRAAAPTSRRSARSV